MTPEIAFTYALFVLTVVLLMSQRVKGDVVGAIVLLALALSGVLTPQEAFSGFSSVPVVIVATVYIIGRGIYRSGLAAFMGDRVLQMSGKKDISLMVSIMGLAAFLSAFLSNLGVVSVLLPVVVRVARKVKVPAGKLLLPMSLAAELGGVLTLVGTPPNLVVAEMLGEKGYHLGVFSFLPIGGAILLAGTLFVFLSSGKLLSFEPAEEKPSRPKTRVLEREYGLRRAFYRVLVLKSSKVLGRSVEELRLREDFNLNLVGVRRSRGGSFLPVEASFVPAPGNVLIVSGTLYDVTRMTHAYGMEILGVVDLRSLRRDIDPSTTVAEMLVPPRSPLAGKSLAEIRFRKHYPINVLAVLRDGKPIGGVLRDIRLHPGDALLVTGPREAIATVSEDGVLTLLTDLGLEPGVRPTGKAILAGAILIGLIAVLVMGILPMTITMALAAFLMVLSGSVPSDEVYEAVDWGVVMLVAGLIPLGLAMEKTGGADIVAERMVHLLSPMGPEALLVGFYLVTSMLTQAMSNTGTALLMAPIALSASSRLGYSPVPFGIAVAIAASTAFLNPAGDLTILIVMNPGGYRTKDVLRMVIPLFVIWFAATVTLVPLIWHF